MNPNQGLFVSLAGALVGFGILMVHSASITSWPTDFDQVYLSRHLIRLAIGIAAAGVCATLPASFWHKAAPFLFAATIALLLLVLVPGIGTRVNGAQRWFRWGPLSVQPSDIAKLTLPIYVCQLLCRHQPSNKFLSRDTFRPLWPVLVTIPLVAIEPDLGTAMFLASGAAIALLVGGWPLRNFLFSAGAAIPAFALLIGLRPYQLRRVTGFLAAWSDFSLAPYQLKQSLISLGAGGAFGVGLGKGWQKLSFLPEANTDFVFAVVGEELGLVGTSALVLLWGGFYFVGLRMLCGLDQRSFAYIASFTLLTQLVLQAALNMAVATALVPTKGIAHPLISYGGSNLVIGVTLVGIVVGLSRSGDSIQSHQAADPEQLECKAA